MKLIQPKAKLLIQPSGLDGVYRQIERCARTCYRSEAKSDGTVEGAKAFVDRMIKSRHTAMLEQGTIYLKAESDSRDDNYWILAYRSYTKAIDCDGWNYMTTNLRAIIELFPTTWHGFFNTYMCEPTEFHERRYTFRLITDRGVSHELVRHRTMSFAQESQRYCNYSKEKYGGEMQFILPNQESGQFAHHIHMTNVFEVAEQTYLNMIVHGCTPQEARAVLPNATKTEIIMTGFSSDWRHFFDLRLFEKTGKVHPDMKHLATLMKAEAEKQGIWDDIMRQSSKFD